MMNLLKFQTVIQLILLNSTPVQKFTVVGQFGRLKVTKMWENQIFGLDPGLNSLEHTVRHFKCVESTPLYEKHLDIFVLEALNKICPSFPCIPDDPFFHANSFGGLPHRVELGGSHAF